MADANEFNTDEPPAARKKLRAVPSVLIVDDCPETRYIYRRYLDRSGYDYQIAEAETVEEGLERIREERFDCVLLDFCLPDADGLELLHELTGTSGVCPVPVVMITGHGNEFIAVDAMKLGAKDYLVKDRMTAEGLVAAVEYALDKARSEQEEHRYKQELEHQSVTDPLTGLHNRRYLFEQLGMELRRSTRYQAPLSLLLIDLDFFKSVNDTHGHVIGDQVLQRFAEMLLDVARSSDIIARYGGEEFCAVLTNTELEGAVHFAERICAEARRLRHAAPGNQDFTVTCSVGVVESFPGDVGVEALIRRSDRALYDAKENGRDQVCVYKEAAQESISA